ncbi:helix-turn-helix transcriptional regulator [Parasphingorhabdus sp.]|uniref:helix-turn-helix transcriptional regulator n=1 Tax=Parasphingorhabdus sp. TaxID=2709688 RepID=UPI003BB19AC9
MSQSESQEVSGFSGARFLRLRDVQHRVGLGRSTIYRWMDQGKFPKSHSIGGYAARWLESDIDQWIASQTSSVASR